MLIFFDFFKIFFLGQQNQQADEVKNKLDEFFLEIREFRNKFRKEAPFTHDGPVDEGKYSKRRRSNVAVISIRIVFFSSFFFYCLKPKQYY